MSNDEKHDLCSSEFFKSATCEFTCQVKSYKQALFSHCKCFTDQLSFDRVIKKYFIKSTSMNQIESAAAQLIKDCIYKRKNLYKLECEIAPQSDYSNILETSCIPKFLNGTIGKKVVSLNKNVWFDNYFYENPNKKRFYTTTPTNSEDFPSLISNIPDETKNKPLFSSITNKLIDFTYSPTTSITPKKIKNSLLLPSVTDKPTNFTNPKQDPQSYAHLYVILINMLFLLLIFAFFYYKVKKTKARRPNSNLNRVRVVTAEENIYFERFR